MGVYILKIYYKTSIKLPSTWSSALIFEGLQAQFRHIKKTCITDMSWKAFELVIASLQKVDYKPLSAMRSAVIFEGLQEQFW